MALDLNAVISQNVQSAYIKCCVFFNTTQTQEIRNRTFDVFTLLNAEHSAQSHSTAR